MTRSIYKTLIIFAFLLGINSLFSQTNLTERDLVGNWKITGGSGPVFDKEMIGVVLTFQKDHHATRIEDGQKVQSDWKLENNTITIMSQYNDGINEPDIEKLSVVSFEEKKLTANYSNDDDEKCIFILERITAP